LEELGIDGRTEIKTAVVTFERTQINPPSLVLLEKTTKKFCDVYVSGYHVALFTAVMRGFLVFNAGRGIEFFLF
jgi:hypothetical protein